MRSVLRDLNPADASTVLSKLMNCLYLAAFIVLAVLAYLRGDPPPALPPMTQAVAVETAPAPAVLPLVPADAPPVVDPDATPVTPAGTGDDAAMGLPQ